MKKILVTIGFAMLGSTFLPAQTIVPTQTNEIIIDNGTSGKADPNDRIRYKVTIQNTGGANGTGTQLNIVPDPRTTFVAGTFRSSPLALPDGPYACTGNVGNPVGLPVPTTDLGTVTCTVSNMIWFVDNSGGAGDGRLGTPFNALSAVNGPTAINQVIFVKNTGTNYTGGIILKNGQILFGTGHTGGSNLANAGVLPFAMAANSKTLPAINGTRPVITNLTGAGITLAMNNTLRGFNVGNTPVANAGIIGSGFGTLILNEVSISGTGQILSLTTGTALASFDELSTSNTTQTAVVLSAVAGNITDNNASNSVISGASGGSNITGGTVSLTFNGDLIHAGANYMVDVLNHTTGTLTFQNGTLLNSSTNTGIYFNNADGIYNFNGTTTLSNGAFMGICAGSSGTFNFSSNTSVTNPSTVAFRLCDSNANVDYNGTLTAGPSSEVVDFDDNTGGIVSFDGNITCPAGSIGITLQQNTGGTYSFTGASKILNTGAQPGVTLEDNLGATINFTNGGLVINTTTAPAFKATGGGTVNVTGSGNTITSGTGTALNVANTTIGASDLNFQSTAKNGGANGIVLNNIGSSGGLTVTGTGAADSGGTIQNTTGSGILATNKQDLSLTRIKILAPGNHGIEATDLRGTCLLANSTIMDWALATGDGFRLVNNNVNLTLLTISTSTFNGTATGNAGVSMEVQGTSNMALSVESNCLFTDMFGDGVQALTTTGSSGTVNVTVKNSTFNTAAAVGNGGIYMAPFGGPANFTFNIEGNTFNDIMRPITNLGAINITDGDLDGNGPVVTGAIKNNTLTNIVGSRGIVVIADTEAGPLDLTVDNNIIDRLGSISKHAINVGIRDNVANAKVKIINNDIGQNPSPAAAGTSWTAGNGTAEAILVLTQNAASANVLLNGNVIDANATLEVMRVRAIGTSTMNATVTNNDLNGTHIEFAAVTASGTPTMCVNISGNILPAAGVGVIQLTESVGTMNVTQASAAAVAAANSSATVTVSSTPTFAQPACSTP